MDGAKSFACRQGCAGVLDGTFAAKMSTAPALELLRAARIPESAAEAYARALAGMGFDTAEALAYLEEDDLQAAGLLLGHLRVLRALLRDGGGRATAAAAAPPRGRPNANGETAASRSSFGVADAPGSG